MRKYIFLACVVLGVLACIPVCIYFIYQSFGPSEETTLGIVTTEYSFDAATIQQAIADGQTDIFHLQWRNDDKLGTPLPTQVPPNPNISLPGWKEFDFMQIVIASAKLTNNDIKDAHLFGVTFNTDCQYANVGFQEMAFSFFNDISDPNSRYRTYLRQFVTVDLQTSRLRWRELRLGEVVRENQPLDQYSTHLQAEDALRIAESTRGASFRLEKNNECYVRGVITEGDLNNEWKVVYEKNESPFAPLLIIFVNQKTGQGRVSTPRP